MDKREQFMLEYYKVAWNNISKTRDGMWKILVPYLGFYAVLGYALDKIGTLGVILLLMGINTFMMVISMNLNMWFLRNLNIISNMELYFLKKEDYGKLIPEYFHEKKTIRFNRPEVWIFAFFSILIVHSLVYVFSLILFCLHEVPKNEFFWISVVFFAGLFVASFFYFYYKAEHNKFLKAAPGYRETEDQYSPKEIEPQNLRLEYEEIGKNMRMYGTLRRQEITLLLIFTGALLAAVAQFEEFAEYFCIFGIIIALFFLFMMKRMTDYYYISRKRAIQIEKLLGMEQFQFVKTELEEVQLSQFTSTRATYFVCMTIVLLWVCILVVGLYHQIM